MTESDSNHLRTKIEGFVSKAVLTMDNEHPNWNHPSDDQPTICSPPFFETVRRNLESENHAVEKVANRGDSSEQKVFDALKKLNNGAIVVANIDSLDIEKHAGIIYREYRKLYSSTSNVNDSGKFHFQCDFILFHWSVGIIIIEVKSTEGNDKELPKEVVAKFGRTIAKLKVLIKVITGEDCFQIPIKAVLTSPNLKLATNYSIQIDAQCSIDIIDSTSDQKVSQYFVEIEVNAKSFEQNFVNCRKFKSIVAFFCCYRRAIYLNEILNAVEVAKLIDSQNLCPQAKKAQTPLEKANIGLIESFSQLNRSSNVLFLTKEQKTIVDSSEKFQIIFGPPGTGKTLVLIAKILKAMQEKSNDRLIVLSYDEYTSCREKLKKIIAAVKTFHRTPIFIGNYKDVISSDEVYRDECGSEDIPFLIKRQKAEGKTFVIFPGVFGAKDVALFLTNCSMHYLGTVMRGTENIVEYWKEKMNTGTSSDDFTIGHGIKGPEVQPPQLYSTFHATLTAVYDHVQWLIKNGAKPNHIAVLNDSNKETEIIAQFLNSKGITTISSRLPTTDQNAAVVDCFHEVSSMEWPFVILCSLTCIDYQESFLLIGSSRAIAHLAVISFDYHSLQQHVEDYLQIQLKCKLVSGYREFETCIETAVRKYLKERNDLMANEGLINECSNMQFSIAAFKLNILTTPNERRPSLFQDCQRLTDCLRIIAQNRKWMQRFVEKYYGDVAQEERENHMKLLRYCLGDTTDGFKFITYQQQRFYHNALKTDASPETLLILNEFQNKFAEEVTLYFRQKIVERTGKRSNGNKIKPTELHEIEAEGRELLEELAIAIFPFISCYPEIAKVQSSELTGNRNKKFNFTVSSLLPRILFITCITCIACFFARKYFNKCT